MRRSQIALRRTFSLLLLLLTVITLNPNKIVYSYSSVEYRKDLKDSPKVLLDAPLISQLPELYNGCEVTCLTMLLNYLGVDVNKVTLANEMIKDTTPLKRTHNGEIVSWGNPRVGFVGDVTGKKSIGYSIYPEGLKPLLDDYLEGKGVILKGEEYSSIEEYLKQHKPVLVWVTSDFKAPRRYVTWSNNNKTIEAYFSQHCVLVTGFSEDFVYYNDPLDLGKNKKVSKSIFISVYNSMGKMALTYD